MKQKNEIQVAWSKAVNDKTNWSYKDKTYGNKIQGKLKAMHYMLYNVVRGLPLERGFSKDSNIFTECIRLFSNQINALGTKGALYDYVMKILSDNVEFFGSTLDIDDFVEKANESLRLYRNS